MSEILARFGRAYAKGAIKEKAALYIEALKEGGIGEAEFQFLIDNNRSLYEEFIPNSWKKAIVEEFKGNAALLENVSDDMLALFVEAMTEEVGVWFARVLTVDKKDWLLRELQHIRQDLESK
jgi:hypothetical protein